MKPEQALVFMPDHPAFAGHFPGAPIVPGVLLLDAALHAFTAETGAAATTIASAKFLYPVAPGEPLTLSLQRSATGSVRFEIAAGSQRAAIGQLLIGPVT